MACRVGMSKTPWARIQYWKDEEGHTHGEILARGLTYDQATARERTEAAQRGCTQSPGGRRDYSSDWSVYHVWGGRTGVSELARLLGGQ